jgi:hypothetical protein
MRENRVDGRPRSISPASSSAAAAASISQPVPPTTTNKRTYSRQHIFRRSLGQAVRSRQIDPQRPLSTPCRRRVAHACSTLTAGPAHLAGHQPLLPCPGLQARRLGRRASRTKSGRSARRQRPLLRVRLGRGSGGRPSGSWFARQQTLVRSDLSARAAASGPERFGVRRARAQVQMLSARPPRPLRGLAWEEKRSADCPVATEQTC